MGKLIALDMNACDFFVSKLLQAWDEGNCVFPLDQRLPQAGKEHLVRAFGVSEIISETGAHRVKGASMEPDDALVIATSGTTGNPKGVVIKNAALQASSRMTSSELGVRNSSDEWLCCIPVSHIGGFSVISRALHNGVGLKLHRKFDATLCEEAGRNGSTLVSLVPTALGRIDPSVFRKVLIGGAAAPHSLPENVVTTYGLTETGSGIVYNGTPLQNVQIEIRDGEIVVQTPTLFDRYLGDEPRNNDAWFATGDAGFFQDDQRLVITGRLDDAIITGGEKVWPTLVERELDSLGLFSEHVVVGRQDQEWGQVVTIVGVPNTPDNSLDIKDIRAQLRDTLPNYALPKAIEIVDNLPRNAMGKILRRSI
ncbi:MAG: AMP-dependent synthetase [Acidimicrobiaceae bacterium]|nr:AMP-dependent synthetase [Acidimicrobiaceae bacterium]|tara:strand:+ start:940 stop:2040 length:1101 start_codon:yes stop_codon:yes gene_type:complete